jgi:hypothetical protein
LAELFLVRADRAQREPGDPPRLADTHHRCVASTRRRVSYGRASTSPSSARSMPKRAAVSRRR